jgi:hypothetical protein
LCLSNLSGKHCIFINGDLLIRLKWLLWIQRLLRGLGGIHVPLVRRGCQLDRSASAEAVWLYVEVVTPYLCATAVIYDGFALCSLVCGRLVMWHHGSNASGGTLGRWSRNVVFPVYWAWRISWISQRALKVCHCWLRRPCVMRTTRLPSILIGVALE